MINRDVGADPDGLHRAFEPLERLAPAEDAVLAGFREGVVKRRRRRQAGSVAGVAVAAGLMVLGVVVVLPGGGGGGQAPVAARPTTSAVASEVPGAVPSEVPQVPPALPFTVTALPTAYRLDTWEVSATEASAQFVGTGDFQTVVVWISTAPRNPVDGAKEEPAMIGGRPGTLRRFAPGDTEQQLIWQLADGRWVMVGGRAPTVSLAALRAVAEGLSLTPTPLPAPVKLGELPDGYQVSNWSGGDGQEGGSAMLCRGTVPGGRGQEFAADCVSLSRHEGTAPTTVLTKLGQQETVEVPVDQVKVVNGVTTRATADGTRVIAQLDADHWAQVFSKGAGVELLRELVSTVGIG